MSNFFKRNSIGFGVILGLLTPVVFFGLFKLIALLTKNFNQFNLQMIQDSTVQLVAIFSNMFALRYYLVKLKADKTGRGILLITFVLAFVFIYINF